MIKIIIRWIIISIAVFLASNVVFGIIFDSFLTVLIVGACLTIFNMFIKPIINILTLPINLITLGLFSLVINGVVFWYLGTLISGFQVTTFYAAFMGALLISIINWVLNKVFHLE